jgi:hypothetical protein
LANLLRQNANVEESIYQLGQGDGMDSVSMVAGQNPQYDMMEESKDNQS